MTSCKIHTQSLSSAHARTSIDQTTAIAAPSRPLTLEFIYIATTLQHRVSHRNHQRICHCATAGGGGCAPLSSIISFLLKPKWHRPMHSPLRPQQSIGAQLQQNEMRRHVHSSATTPLAQHSPPQADPHHTQTHETLANVASTQNSSLKKSCDGMKRMTSSLACACQTIT